MEQQLNKAKKPENRNRKLDWILFFSAIAIVAAGYGLASKPASDYLDERINAAFITETPVPPGVTSPDKGFIEQMIDRAFVTNTPTPVK